MVATHRSIIAGAVLLVASAAGASADSYGGMRDVPVAMMQPASWYVRGDYSYAWQDAGALNAAIVPFDSFSMGDGWAVGGGIGHYFGRGVRGDVTYEWRGDTGVHGTGTFGSDFNFRSQVLLANLYYDFRPYERFNPYIGVGLGAAYHSSGGGTITAVCGVCSYDGGSNWSAAGALMAGFSLRIDRGGHAPVSIKDQPMDRRARPSASRCRLPSPLHGRCPHRWHRRLGRPDARPAPGRPDGTGNSRRLAVGHPLAERHARAADKRPGTTE